MRIAVSAESDSGLESKVSPHFGRCPYYVLVDLEGDGVPQVTTITNPYYSNHQPGQVPAFIRSQGADVMVSGGMGARATAFFSQYGIEVATGASGTVAEAIKRYLRGELSGEACCSGDHEQHSSCH